MIVGYELQGQEQRPVGEAMEGVDGLDGKGKEREGYVGKVLFLLPGGVQSTDVMMGRRGGAKKIGEQDVGIKGDIAVFE